MSINKEYIDQNWVKVETLIENLSGKQPQDVNAILFLIGIQESGIIKKFYSKEQKQDLIHIGICSIFSLKGYYQYTHTDAEGWPHYQLNEKLPHHKMLEQEYFIKEHIINYFENKNLIKSYSDN